MKSIWELLAVLSNQTRRLSSRLGRLPAFLYLLAYLLVILVFTVIYAYALPGSSFYHPTTPYESDLADNNSILLHDLQAELIQMYRSSGASNQVVYGWKMLTDDLLVNDLYVGDLPSEFSFGLAVPAQNQAYKMGWLMEKVSVKADAGVVWKNVVYLPFHPEYLTAGPVNVGIPSDMSMPSFGMLWQYKLVWMGPIVTQPPSKPDPFAPGQPLWDTGTEAVLPLSLDLYRRIIDSGPASPGLLSKVRPEIWRMLYFSAGVAISSATGDLVPVSTGARSSVTAERVCAVILIALFLNSLAYDVGDALTGAQKAKRKTDRSVSSRNGQPRTKRAGNASEPAASQKGSKPLKNPTPKPRRRVPSRP